MPKPMRNTTSSKGLRAARAAARPVNTDLHGGVVLNDGTPYTPGMRVKHTDEDGVVWHGTVSWTALDLPAAAMVWHFVIDWGPRETDRRRPRSKQYAESLEAA